MIIVLEMFNVSINEIAELTIPFPVELMFISVTSNNISQNKR